MTAGGHHTVAGLTSSVTGVRQTLPTPPPGPEIYSAELAVRVPTVAVGGCRAHRETRRGRWGR
ncbi:hypothetical protein L227DRAFT_76352 [Lentinus tigrinus ALCF2SS1-6]|uniref:Uncharacterized protein n=1 Tax=Lentinus tigrinus ALCF2SS1-6 TaxID=1328759 RepID=A0A5C2SBA8_9APHY|nr:hypothetical protein L227DRAFT_76352 [Lentinus tigrinus ALCF2SS1-6]